MPVRPTSLTTEAEAIAAVRTLASGYRLKAYDEDRGTGESLLYEELSILPVVIREYIILVDDCDDWHTRLLYHGGNSFLLGSWMPCSIDKIEYRIRLRER